MTLLNQFPHIKWYYNKNTYHQLLLYTKHIGELDMYNLHFSLTEKQIKAIYEAENN